MTNIHDGEPTHVHDDRFDLDGGQWEAMRETFREAGGSGTERSYACTVAPRTDHVHVRRLGALGSGIGGRVAVLAHDSDGYASVYLTPAHARMLAADLLNGADDLDGGPHLPAPVSPPQVAPKRRPAVLRRLRRK